MGKEATYIQKKDKRPWGSFEVLSGIKIKSNKQVNSLQGEDCVIKYLNVKPEQVLSYQSHKMRRENWIVVQGCAKITIDGHEQILFPGQSAVIQARQKHRLANPDKTKDLIVVEVSTGTFNEKDNTRYDDIYNRNK